MLNFKKRWKKKYGITGKLGIWLRNFFEERKQLVLIEETKSEKSEVVSGAVQGSVLGPVFFLMFIGDITEDLEANTKLFVDDAKVKKLIEAEEDVEKLQDSMNKLYEWETENKMKFNGSKFQILRYGPNEELKNNTLYFTGQMEEVIMQFSSLRDLGVIMSDVIMSVDAHIEKVVRKVRQKVGWLFRSFYTRRLDILKQLWKTLVQCDIDYCSQLYMPSQTKGMQAIKKLFADFSAKIPELKGMNYWARLSHLKMYSQERRMERYRILFVWKIIEGYAPNCGIETSTENQRLGRKCKIPKLVTNGRRYTQTLRESSFQTNGARLFNCIPKKIREIKIDQEYFKIELDKFLSSVPDDPKLGSLVPTAVCRVSASQSNCQITWIQET